MKKIILVAWVLLVLFSVGQSQNILSPEEFLGYELGTRFTRHHKVVEYYRYVAGQLDYMKVEKYGETYENRELIIAILSSSENFQNLEEIRVNNLRRTGLTEGNPSANGKAIVWLSYNVHGNESVSMEASMQTLYELANPNNSETQEWLKNTVVILDPCINPDGRDRYANFYNQYGNQVPNPDPNSKEHREIWPGGRTNHYLFDLNRDWAWLKQVESEQRLKKYQEWMPMVHVDFHEQGVNSPYYFAPAAEPFHKMITDWQREFQTIIGKNHAKYFDENNWLYFTKERFDLLYPSYGDTYPTYNGAIGMTYEQGGSGRAGLTVTTELGDELTLKDRIAHHHTNGLSTVEITSKNADRVIDEFQKFFKEAHQKSEYKSFIIKGSNSPEKLQQLSEFLNKHQIQYGLAEAGRKALNGFDYFNNRNASFNIGQGDIVVNVYQPKGTLVSILFEPDTYYSDSLTYDITAWSIPYSMGLEAYAVSSRINIRTEYPGKPVVNNEIDENAYAYFIEYNSFQSARFLAFLQTEGVNVRSAGKSVTYKGKAYQPGTLIITQRNNEHIVDLPGLLKEGSRKFNLEVNSTTTGFMDGGVDLGSGEISFIEAPKVALLGGSGTSSLSFGEAWYFMEQELGYQVTVLDTDYFLNVDLSEYDVLIVPNGYYSIFDEDARSEIGTWVSNGGRLILMGGALRAFADQEGFALKRFATEQEKTEAEEESKRDPLQNYSDQERESISDDIIGAIFKARLDNSHPLAYGYEDFYFTLKTSSSRYAWMENEWNVATLPENTSAVAGFSGFKAEKSMSKSLLFGVENKGRGNIIYMVDNPLFRAFWENGKMLMSNAIFMVGQ